ncbi:hypothetical protein D3C71_1903540 [compost metagenome]
MTPEQQGHGAFSLVADEAIGERARHDDVAIGVRRSAEGAAVTFKGPFVRDVLDAQTKFLGFHSAS